MSFKYVVTIKNDLIERLGIGEDRTVKGALVKAQQCASKRKTFCEEEVSRIHRLFAAAKLKISRTSVLRVESEFAEFGLSVNVRRYTQ
jgi:hypothetical protein